MPNLDIAEQTWKWLVTSGRVGAEGIARKRAIPDFFATVVTEWEKAGEPRFMQGMKDVMMSIIWEG